MSIYGLCCLLILMTGSINGRRNWENAALNKQCSMTSSYTGGGWDNSCSTAINGNTETTYRSGNCMHTGTNDKTPSWTVDLGENYTVERITIFARDLWNTRMTNIQVLVDDVLVYQFPSNSTTIQLKTDIGVSSVTSGSSLPKKGRRVKLFRKFSTTEYILMNVCEVQVWVCRPGYYGGDCQPCITACSGKACDDIDNPNDCPEANLCWSNPCQHGGSCQQRADSYKCSCVPGYDGINCQNDINECESSPCGHGRCIRQVNSYTCSCDSGYSGPNCSTDIDECASNPCINGTCQDGINFFTCSCSPGFTGNLCQTGCDSQHYGVNCNNTCGAGCNDGTCDSVSGRCIISKCLPDFQQTPHCDQEAGAQPLASGSENLIIPIGGAILGAAVIIGGCVLRGSLLDSTYSNLEHYKYK